MPSVGNVIALKRAQDVQCVQKESVAGRREEETEMDSDYIFLCGVMWCKSECRILARNYWGQRGPWGRIWAPWPGRCWPRERVTCESWRKKQEERSVDETDRAGKTTKLYVPLSDECQTPLT